MNSNFSKNKILFSIIIPIIKAKFLDNAIKSVLSQTNNNWELILYNDGSKDDIDNLVSKYKDKRIIYKKGNKNIGSKDPSLVWNLMLDYTSGNYICLIGDDDKISSNYLEEMEKIILGSNGQSLFRSKLKRIDENDNIFFEGKNLPEFERCDEFLYERLINNRIQSTSEFIIKKEDLLKINGYINFPRACGSDDATYLLLAKENGVVSTNKTFAFWRKSDLNISDNDSEKVNSKKALKYLEWEIKFLNDYLFNSEYFKDLFILINNRIKFYKDEHKKIKINDFKKNLKYIFKI